jgi:hypothetical protein
VKAPAVFICADGDGTVPPKYQKMVVDAYRGSKRIVELHGGHNHSTSGDEEGRLRDQIDWLAQRVVR